MQPPGKSARIVLEESGEWRVNLLLETDSVVFDRKLGWKCPGVEGERSGKVRGEVSPVVAARIEMEFMSDAAGSEDLVESDRARVEAEVILIAAIEVDFEPGEIGGARQR